MKPLIRDEAYFSKLGALGERWYELAKRDGTTSERLNLYIDTHQAVMDLEELGKTEQEQAKKFANLILMTFDKHEKGKDAASLKLAEWISKNTAPSGEGAYAELHHLFQTIAKINALEIGTSEALVSLKNIEVLADNYIKEDKNVSDAFVDDVNKRIVKEYVQSHSVADAKALKMTSKEMQEQVSQIHHGDLGKLRITTADEAINYVFEHGKDLKFIDISSITFTLEEFKEFIEYVPNLTTFVATSCEFTDEFVKELAALKDLTTLNLASNAIGPEGAAAIATLINLTTLDLMYNKIGDEGAKSISALAKLTTLNLGNNNIGPKGAKDIGNALKYLTTLNLLYNTIEEEGARSISTLTRLKYLYLNGNNIGNGGARAIATLTNLITLYLTNNNIKGEIEEFASLTNLEELYLNDNKIGDNGVNLIAKLIKLTTLELSNNGVGSQGVEKIAPLINLTSLNLNNNKIEDGDKIVVLIRALTKLTTLEIRDNLIESAGVNAIQKEAESRPHLKIKYPEV